MSKKKVQAAKPEQSPLEAVKEQQAARQQDEEVTEHRIESQVEVPGGGAPSNRRKHPQRQNR